MGLPRDDRVTDPRTRRRSAEAERFGAGDGDVVPCRTRESVAQRLEREWAERDRAEQAQRAELERRRAERDRAIEQRLEERQRARLERLRRERAEGERKERRTRSRRKRSKAPEAVQAKSQVEPRAEPPKQVERPTPKPARARVEPGVKG